MKTILTHFDRLMAAITFAEENEPEFAMEFASDHKPNPTNLTQATKVTDSKVLKIQAVH